MRNLKIVLIEKNCVMLERLVSVIEAMDNFWLTGRFADLQRAAKEIEDPPDIILLDIDNNDVDEINIVRQYVKEFPFAGIICTSLQWNEKLASDVVKTGAKGYLIKPFTAEELRRTLITFEKNGLGKLCNVTAFFSPKGKSGKTTLIANLAMELSTAWHKTVAVIDADVQFGDMAVFFNLQPESTIVEAVRDIKFLSPVTLEQYFTPVNENLKVLCGTKTPELAEYVNPQALIELIEMARRTYQYVLVDLPPAFNPVSVATTEVADHVFIVAMINGTYEIENTKRSMEIFKVWENFDQKVHPVFTRVWPYNDKEQASLENKLNHPIFAIIPNEYSLISSAVNEGHIAVKEKPESSFAESIEIFANRFCHRLEVK